MAKLKVKLKEVVLYHLHFYPDIEYVDIEMGKDGKLVFSGQTYRPQEKGQIELAIKEIRSTYYVHSQRRNIARMIGPRRVFRYKNLVDKPRYKVPTFWDLFEERIKELWQKKS